jgi:hypothetical protein
MGEHYDMPNRRGASREIRRNRPIDCGRQGDHLGVLLQLAQREDEHARLEAISLRDGRNQLCLQR